MINQGDVAINEVMASNTSTAADQNGEFDDWIELYNNSSNYISLNNAYLSDSYSTPLKWKFPDNTTIAPNNYLIVWADKDTTQSGLHANFKLSGSGEKIILSYASGDIVDSVIFGTQTADISYQRCPNGTGSFITSSPSYGYANCITGISENENNSSLIIFPNPANSSIQIKSDLMFSKVGIYNALSQLVYSNEERETSLSIDLSAYPNGIYFIKINDSNVKKIIVQH
jgi:hypothetical protein